MSWKPGRPLPHVRAGYPLMAWPSARVLAHIKIGHTVPLMAVTHRTNMARAYRSLENAAGIVNLEAEPISPDSCVPGLPEYQSDQGSHATTVMQSYSTISGMTQNFAYGQGQSSSLEVGFSASGDSGTFGGNGTTSVSTDASIGYAPQTGASKNHLQTYFEWGKYYIPNSCPQEVGYETMPPAATHCAPYHPQDKFTKSTTTASTVKARFTVTPVGFTGTAQTGYSKTAAIQVRLLADRPTVRRE